MFTALALACFTDGLCAVRRDVTTMQLQWIIRCLRLVAGKAACGAFAFAELAFFFAVCRDNLESHEKE